jgi:carotenoid 1,2-hydratase
MVAQSGRLAAAAVLADLASTAPIPSGGYAWWYVDALSDDGAHALTLIAMLGNVFSPFYARARAQGGPADPLAHCTMNVALYGPRARKLGAHRARAARRLTARHGAHPRRRA